MAMFNKLAKGMMVATASALALIATPASAGYIVTYWHDVPFYGPAVGWTLHCDDGTTLAVWGQPQQGLETTQAYYFTGC